ncbi:MAG: 3-hydroxylacyl-ACP dehydratase [Gammaproteobacteria bacterium]
MTRARLEELLSHRDPMLLLDELTDEGDTYAESIVRITPKTAFFEQGRGVPSWIGIEYMAQTIGIVAGSQSRSDGGGAAMGYLLGTRRYRCSPAWFTDGQILKVRCDEQLTDNNGLGVYSCSIRDGETLANARLTVFRKPPDE